MLHRNKKLFLHSSDFNLKQVCPSILKYEDRRNLYLNETFTFRNDSSLINSYSSIQDPNAKIAAFSSFLVFNILNNFLDNKAIVKKDIENYYNSQMLFFLRTNNLLNHFKLKYLAEVWSSINKIVDILIKDISKYDKILINQDIHWSDTVDNFYHTVPYIGVVKESVEVFLILQTDLDKYPLYNKPIDYLKIPSVVFTLKNFINQNITINKLKILWLDNSNITHKIKYSIYKNIDTNYILDNTSVLNLTNNSSIQYNNLKVCYTCPYFDPCFTNKTLTEKVPSIETLTIDNTIFEKDRKI